MVLIRCVRPPRTTRIAAAARLAGWRRLPLMAPLLLLPLLLGA
eukprot:COSAG06_NODE_64412_length_259_cov_1.268750_1_plen_42_part_10